MTTPVAPAHRPAGRPPAAESVPLDVLLDSALEAFATQGYDGVSVRTLNRELGVSHNLIHQRFGSKLGLWRAAVDRGFGGLVRAMESAFDPTLTDPLEQLALVIRRFLLHSAEHPELLGLMNIEARQDTDRLRYIFETYIGPATAGTGRLVAHLVDQGRIRPVPPQTLHFLIAHGGAAPFTLLPLARYFNPSSPVAADHASEQAQLVTDLLIAGLRLDR